MFQPAFRSGIRAVTAAPTARYRRAPYQWRHQGLHLMWQLRQTACPIQCSDGAEHCRMRHSERASRALGAVIRYSLRCSVSGSPSAPLATCTWTEKFENWKRINSIRETNGSFVLCDSFKRPGISRLYKLHESKPLIASHIEFIRSKFSNFPDHVNRVIRTSPTRSWLVAGWGSLQKKKKAFWRRRPGNGFFRRVGLCDAWGRRAFGVCSKN